MNQASTITGQHGKAPSVPEAQYRCLITWLSQFQVKEDVPFLLLNLPRVAVPHS